MFGEHGLVEHNFGVYNELINVPLVIRGGEAQPGIDRRVVSTRCLYHTILSLAGIALPHGPNLSLLGNTVSEPAVYSEGRVNEDSRRLLEKRFGVDPSSYDRLAVFAGGRKGIIARGHGHGSLREVYDLEDIREETNRIGDDEACRPVQMAMTAGHCHPPLGEPLTGNEPRAGIDSLRMLGYVE